MRMWLTLILTVMTNAASAMGMEPVEIKDIDGKIHSPFSSGAKAVVLIAYSASCPVLRRMSPTIKGLAKKYETKGVRFYLLASAPQDTVETLKREREIFNLGLPVLHDSDQKLLRKAGLRVTTQAALIDGGTREIQYVGAIDNQFSYEGAKAKASSHDLADAVESHLAGRAPMAVASRAVGCIITLNETAR